MRLHLAGLLDTNMWLDGRNVALLSAIGKHHRMQVPHMLESYYYFNSEQRAERLRKTGERIFLDSGAFTAWTKGATIDIHAYCDYAKSHADLFTEIACLDVIGSEVDTYKNLCTMERLGVQATPVFHMGESIDALNYYAANYERIALGGFGIASLPNIKVWLDRLWADHLTNEDGSAKVKVHGFAITSPELMYRYPWDSVDSSSWIQIASRGSIIGYEFGAISVSPYSPSRKVAGQHFMTKPTQDQAMIRAWIEAQGYSPEVLADNYLERRAFCIRTYTRYNDDINKQKTKTISKHVDLFEGI